MGLIIKPPQKECNDRNCPFHGRLKIRGRILEGRVVRDKMERSVIVNIDYLKYYPKYERYARMRSRIPAHNPPCIGAKTGDKVKIMECRPISKTKAFVVVEKVEDTNV